MKIGVFDSGVGGKSFVSGLQKRFPNAEIVYKEDRKNLPYGDKSTKQLMLLTLPIFKTFEQEGCDVVLVACNTVTTNCIAQLRDNVSIPLVGVEPMVKPAAAMTKTNTIAVCATPKTLASSRYAELKDRYAKGVYIIEPDCSRWAALIEDNRENELELARMVSELREGNADVIVLGCTHYHWIDEALKKFAKDDICVIQPIEPVLNQVARVIAPKSSLPVT